MDVNVLASPGEKKSWNFRWVLPLFIRPRKTTAEIVAQDKSVWLTPLLILSALVLISVLIAAPVRRTNIQMGADIPVDFQYYSEDMQAQFYAAQEKQTSPLFMYVFPLLSGLFRYWVSWFILGILLYLSLTLAGSRAGSVKSYNLAAWSFLPFALRYVVQILGMLFSRHLVTAPGLSGFVSAEATGISAYAGQLLGLIDVFFIFQVILLFLGVVPLSGLARNKAWTATAISLVILVLIQAVPGFISSALSGISMNGFFFF